MIREDTGGKVKDGIVTVQDSNATIALHRPFTIAVRGKPVTAVFA